MEFLFPIYGKLENSMFQTTNQSSFSIILTTTLPNLVATIQIHTVWLQFENLSSHVILTHTHIRREIKTGGSSFTRRSSVALASLQALSKCSSKDLLYEWVPHKSDLSYNHATLIYCNFIIICSSCSSAFH